MKWFGRKSGSKRITFRAQSEHVWQVRERPIPASKMLPDWWKTLPHYSSDDNTLKIDGSPTVTVKRCLSALDGLAAGYYVTLWADIMVSYSEEHGTTIQWNTDQPLFQVWPPSQVSNYELPEGFQQPVFKYMYGWTIKTPHGYSSLIIPPIAYPNQPFRAIAGVVDTDTLSTDINTPIVFKKGFEGIIEKGTPMFQVIPIKRDDWTSEFIKEKPQELYFNQERLRSKIVSSYGRYLRSAKKYE